MGIIKPAIWITNNNTFISCREYVTDKSKTENSRNGIARTHKTPLEPLYGEASPLDTPRLEKFRRLNSKHRAFNGGSQNDSFGVNVHEIQVPSNPELIGRPDPLIRVHGIRVPFRIER